VNIYELINDEDDSSYQNVSTTRPRASSQPLSTDLTDQHTVLYSAQSASDEAPAASSKLDPANNNVYVPPAADADNSSSLNDVPCCYQLALNMEPASGTVSYVNFPQELDDIRESTAWRIEQESPAVARKNSLQFI